MKPLHTIRLGDPWKRHTAGNETIFSRTFHAPTGIDSTESVWVVIDRQSPPAEIRCNETVLGTADGYAAFEITPLLRSSNRLTILLPGTEHHDRQRGSVHLEMRSAEKHNS